MATEVKETRETALAPFKDVLDILAPYGVDRYHRLVPTAMQQRSPLYAPAVQVVKVNADDARDVYATPGSRDGTVCLHSSALLRIANAVGINFGQTRFERHETLFVTAHVPFEVVDALGERRRGSASKTIDLRDGSIQAKLLGGGLQAARQFVNERAESGARSRVVKAWTGMPTSFSKDELQKPFVALRWTLDVNQPDVRKALIEAGTRAQNDVFGHEGAPLEIADGDDDIVEGEVVETSGRVVEQEPEIPDETTAKPNVGAIIAALQQKAKAGSRDKVGDREGTVAFAIRDALGLGNKVDKNELAAVRRALVNAIFGVAVSDLTGGQVRVFIDSSKELQGHKDMRAIFDQQVEVDPALKPIAAKVGASLADEARSL